MFRCENQKLAENASETNIGAEAYYFATAGAQAKNLPIQSFQWKKRWDNSLTIHLETGLWSFQWKKRWSHFNERNFGKRWSHFNERKVGTINLETGFSWYVESVWHLWSFQWKKHWSSGHSKTLGPLAKNLLIQTLETILKDKNKSGSFQALETVFLKSH